MGNTIQDLTPKQKALVADYMGAYERAATYYADRERFMVDFLTNPNGFIPTDVSKRTAYVEFILRRFDEGRIKRRTHNQNVVLPIDVLNLSQIDSLPKGDTLLSASSVPYAEGAKEFYGKNVHVLNQKFIAVTPEFVNVYGHQFQTKEDSVLFQSEIMTEEIDWDRLRNVRVEVDYRYSSTMSKDSAVVDVCAEARKDKSSEWEPMRSGGVAFGLEDFVQKK